MGSRLRHLRGHQTQTNLAKAIGIDNTVLSRIESDAKKKVDPNEWEIVLGTLSDDKK